MNAFEHAEDTETPIYAISYDLSKAYDRVEWALLAWAMQRMSIPNKFIRLILSMLLRTKTRIQTTHGLSRISIHLEKGVPQGDPIAPILFNITIDALFDILRKLTKGWSFQTDQPTAADKTLEPQTAQQPPTTTDAHQPPTMEDTQQSPVTNDAQKPPTMEGDQQIPTAEETQHPNTRTLTANAYADDIIIFSSTKK